MDYIRRQINARKDAKTLDSFRNQPSTFLKKHTVNTMWPEVPSDPNNQSQQNRQFFLVEQEGHKPATRPDTVFGNLRMHKVKNYALTTDLDSANALGRIVGNFHAPHLAVRQTGADNAPNLQGLQPSSLNLQPIPNKTSIHTMDLSGCTIIRQQQALFHVQPQESGTNLHTALGNQHTFGANEYGENQNFVMLRKKTKGVKLYSQTIDAQGRPNLQKKYL